MKLRVANPLRRSHGLCALALACVLAFAAGAAPARADSLPAPEGCSQYFSPQPAGCNSYNTTNDCTPYEHQVTLEGQAGGDYCGPWTVPQDPGNSYQVDSNPGVYWAAEKRPDLGAYGWGYAYTWSGNAQAAGYSVTSTPQPGDVVVWSQAQGDSSAGHIAYVEAVNPDGSIVVSEMNSFYGDGGDIHVIPETQSSDSYGWSDFNDQGPLQFIHMPNGQQQQPPSNPGSGSSPGSGSNPGPGIPAASPPPVSQPLMRVKLSPIHRSGHLQRQINFTARITHGAGTITAEAVKSGRHIRLSAKHPPRNPLAFTITGTLAPGRWTIVVTYHASRGYSTPAPTRLKVKVP